MKAAEQFASVFGTAWLSLRGENHPEAPVGPPRRILILGFAAIGDMIFFLPVIEGLRHRYPQAKITLIMADTPITKELLPGTGLIDEIWYDAWELPEGVKSTRRQINRRIAEAGFDLALLTLSSPAHYYQWGLRNIPVRVGHCRQFENVRSWSPSGWYRHLRRLIITGELARRALLNRKVWISLKSEHAVRRNLRLLSALDIPLPPAERPPLLPVAENSASVSRAFEGFEPAKKKVALHLGPPNNQYHKIWAPERFGRLCCALARLCPVEILAVGTSDELDSVETARAEYPALRSWVGKSSLLETFAIIKRCDLFISNDTGMAKAAMALGVPTITLMGLSDPEEVGIIWDKDKHLEIRTGISCSPCARLGMAKFGGLNYLNCGHHDCLQKLEVDFALGAIRKKYGYNLEEIPHA